MNNRAFCIGLSDHLLLYLNLPQVVNSFSDNRSHNSLESADSFEYCLTSFISNHPLSISATSFITLLNVEEAILIPGKLIGFVNNEAIRSAGLPQDILSAIIFFSSSVQSGYK